MSERAPLTMTKEREAHYRKVIGFDAASRPMAEAWKEIDATREVLQWAERNAQRFSSPWTVGILNPANGEWLAFCNDAPLTLADAEKREGELKAEHPDAKFRVGPWFNSIQKQTIQRELQRERELADQLAAALETNLVFVDPGTNAAARIRAALAQHAAVRSGK